MPATQAQAMNGRQHLSHLNIGQIPYRIDIAQYRRFGLPAERGAGSTAAGSGGRACYPICYHFVRKQGRSL
jgi:hypothetical protein